MVCIALVGGVIVSTSFGAGENRLTLAVPAAADRCVQPNEPVTLSLSMSDLTKPVVGYQAFLAFDPTALTFQSGTYQLPLPFGMPLLYPIAATPGGEIDVAAGIFPGQPPTMSPSELVVLHFVAGAPEGRTNVVFRAHSPPTEFIGADDLPVIAFLRDSPPIIVTTDTSTNDSDGDGVPDPCDLCPGFDDRNDADGDGFPDACDQFGDADHDADVDLVDWIAFANCLSGPGIWPSPTPPVTQGACLDAFDSDGDADVDLFDFAEFQRRISTP
jgi:hypothetical protein